MLALYSSEPPAPDILEALEAASLLASSSGPPLNLMGDLSVDEQKAWQRGANSDQSMRTYSKQEGGPGNHYPTQFWPMGRDSFDGGTVCSVCFVGENGLFWHNFGSFLAIPSDNSLKF